MPRIVRNACGHGFVDHGLGWTPLGAPLGVANVTAFVAPRISSESSEVARPGPAFLSTVPIATLAPLPPVQYTPATPVTFDTYHCLVLEGCGENQHFVSKEVQCPSTMTSWECCKSKYAPNMAPDCSADTSNVPVFLRR